MLGSRLASLALVLVASAPLARSDSKVPIGWGKEQFTSAKIPSALGTQPKKAIAEWEPWAAANDYRIDVTPKGRVILLSPADSSQAARHLELIDRTEKWFDRVLPVPDRKPLGFEKKAAPPSADGPGVSSGVADEIPEDPESAPPVVIQPGAAKTVAAGSTYTEWGAAKVTPDTVTGVVLALHDEDDAESAAAHIAKTHAGLASWAAKVKEDVGFVIEMPLVAACVANASGQEEWNPDHELVSRVARLLTLRRFGQTPLWALYGIAWEAEVDLDGEIYVFPYRDEFIGVGEHGAWPHEIKNEFKDRVKKPLELSEFAAMQRGTYDGRMSRFSWGFVHFLTSKHPAKLSGVLEEMRQLRDAEGRVVQRDGTWERDVDYEIPLEDQDRILKKHCGPEVFKGASAFLRKLGDEPEKSLRK